MPASSPLQVHQLIASVHFIQGYRYLDRCGDAMIKLEDVLAPGWITAETTPKAGILKNDGIGMAVNFNSTAMSAQQVETISFEHFLDQTCKAFDILWQSFDITRIHLPSIRIIFQKGFSDDEIEIATQFLLDMKICVPKSEVVALLQGQPEALDFVLVTTKNLTWNEVLVHQRRRLEGKVVRQEKQLPFDERLLKRSRQLGDKQREAIEALVKLRRQHRAASPVAIQIDLENSFETEFSSAEFDFPAFLQESWDWAETVRSGLAH